MQIRLFDVPGGTQWHGHAHDQVHLCAVVRGGLVHEAKSRLLHLEEGTLRFSPPASHDLRFGPQGASCLIVELTRDDWPGRDLLALPADPDTRQRMASLARGLTGPAPAARLRLEALALELLARGMRTERGRSPGAPPSWLSGVRDLLAELPTGGTSPISHAARRAGVHRGHLARLFHEYYGESMSGFLRRARLARAVELLRDEPLSLAQVAVLAGYVDQSHFTRAFRARFGEPPGVWRRRAMRPRYKTTGGARA